MTLIYFILIIGLIIFVHELGHFIFAKRSGVHVYEFSLGMGPVVYHFRRPNDETIYAIRAFPIGGFVSMAGEEVNEKEKIAKSKKLYAKPWRNRALIITAGVLFNFILAWVLLFMVALINGAPPNKPVIDKVWDDYEISEHDIGQGDVITGINGVSIRSIDRLFLELHLNYGKEIDLEYLSDGEKNTITIAPKKEEIEDIEAYRYGFVLKNEPSYGVSSALSFAFNKFYNIIEQMYLVIALLISGGLAMDSLSGPVGIFNIVGETAQVGFLSVMMLVALISINVGVINLLPFPALDGGRLWFLIIEKIKGSPVDPKVENVIHMIGFALLIFLIIYITINDIIGLF